VAVISIQNCLQRYGIWTRMGY